MPPTPSTTDPEWRFRRFDDLPNRELYALLALRQRVFVLEQGCTYVDADGRDPEAWHLLGWQGQGGGPDRRLLAVARLFERLPERDGMASIGRVAVDLSARGRGIGRLLLAEAVARCDAIAPGAAIHIQAQAYLERFYGASGFRRVGPGPYLHDGIVHLDMVRPAGSGVGILRRGAKTQR